MLINEGKKGNMEFMQHNILMYFKNEFGFDNIKETILADKVIITFKDLSKSKILTTLNNCINEFDDDFKMLKIRFKVVASFEILLGNNDCQVIKFNYKLY